MCFFFSSNGPCDIIIHITSLFSHSFYSHWCLYCPPWEPPGSVFQITNSDLSILFIYLGFLFVCFYFLSKFKCPDSLIGTCFIITCSRCCVYHPDPSLLRTKVLSVLLHGGAMSFFVFSPPWSFKLPKPIQVFHVLTNGIPWRHSLWSLQIFCPNVAYLFTVFLGVLMMLYLFPLFLEYLGFLLSKTSFFTEIHNQIIFFQKVWMRAQFFWDTAYLKIS